MARSYYGLDKVTGYSPNIDFRSIRQEVNTELERISKEREEKKKTIEENTRLAIEAARSDIGMGAIDQLNDHLLGATDQILENISFQENLRRTGGTSVSNYNKFVQNSKASIDHIHQMSKRIQDRAKELQEDGIHEVDIFLSDLYINNDFLQKNTFFQNPTTGEIMLVGTDENGEIKFDADGNLVDKKTPLYMSGIMNREVLRETDFDAMFDSEITSAGKLISTSPGEYATIVPAAIDNMYRKLSSLDNLEISDFLSQQYSESQFGFTRDREEARKSADEYMSTSSEIADLITRKEQEGLSEEEINSIDRELMSLDAKLRSTKVFMYANETDQGPIIDIEILPVHRKLMHDAGSMMIDARIGKQIIPEQQQGYNAQQVADRNERAKELGIVNQLTEGLEMLASGDQDMMMDGFAKIQTVMAGEDATMTIRQGANDYTINMLDPTGKVLQTYRSTLNSAEAFTELGENLLNRLGYYNYANNLAPINYKFNPRLVVGFDFPDDKSLSPGESGPAQQQTTPLTSLPKP